MAKLPPIKLQETKDAQVITIPKPSTKYLNAFVGLKCSGDLLNTEVFPNVKEITEAMSVFAAIRRHIEGYITRPGLNCLVVGDGSTPRVGAMIAFRTKWNVFSVDPALRIKPSFNRAKRLTTIKLKLEEFLKMTHKPDFDVVVAVHSHAPTLPMGKLLTVEIPCCGKGPQGYGASLIDDYEDMDSSSGMRRVYVYGPAWHKDWERLNGPIPSAADNAYIQFLRSIGVIG